MRRVVVVSLVTHDGGSICHPTLVVVVVVFVGCLVLVAGGRRDAGNDAILVCAAIIGNTQPVCVCFSLDMS